MTGIVRKAATKLLVLAAVFMLALGFCVVGTQQAQAATDTITRVDVVTNEALPSSFHAGDPVVQPTFSVTSVTSTLGAVSASDLEFISDDYLGWCQSYIWEGEVDWFRYAEDGIQDLFFTPGESRMMVDIWVDADAVFTEDTQVYLNGQKMSFYKLYDSDTDFVGYISYTAYAEGGLGDLPYVQLSDDGIMTIGSYGGAAEYKVTFIDEYYSMSFKSTRFDLCAKMKSSGFATGDYRLRVVALNANDVEISNPTELTYYGYYHPALDQATNLRWDGTTAKWDSVAHATDYTIYVMRKGKPGYSDTLEYYGGVYETSFDCTRIITDTEAQYYFYIYSSDWTDEYATSKSEDSPLTYGIAFEYRDITNLRLSDDGVLTWDAYPGAAKYNISVEVFPNNFYGDSTSDTSFDLRGFLKTQGRPSGDYPFTIYAGDDEGYRISNEMNRTYTGFVNESLDNPVNLRWEGKVAKWDAVANADEYTVILRRNHAHVTTASTSSTEVDFSDYIVSTADTYTFLVMASDSTDNYGDSSWVESAPAGFVFGLTATVEPAEFQYDGAAHKPSVAVKDSEGNTLTEGTHYTLSFPDDCVSTGTKQITITGKSPYTGSMTVEYVIRGSNIADATVATIPDHPYDGNAYTPAPVVTYGGKTLTEGVDYTYVLQNSMGQTVTPAAAGTYRAVITGKNNFTGSKAVSFMINPIDLSGATVSSVEYSYDFTGSEIKPVPTVKLMVGGILQTLVAETDFVVDYGSNIYPGTATYAVIGTGNYSGTIASLSFAITAKPGWVKAGGYWYFFNNDGSMVKDTWKKDSKGWCWLGSDGRMVTNQWVKDSKGFCWVDSSGYWVTSTKWLKIGSDWYHITKGYRDQSKWMKDSHGWCYLGADGKMVTNGWAKDSKGWCWMGGDGYWVADMWVYDGGFNYYIKSNHYMAKSETLEIDGVSYTFDSSGRQI
ncbi:MAG: hypothetical protein K6G78_00035 [bacterium]|nr:hypothetical protein [bacterium]